MTTTPNDAARLADIGELYHLWEPVYPFLADHLRDLYGRDDGAVVEMGPFCGAAFALCERGIGETFRFALFPGGLEDLFRSEAERLGLAGRFDIVASDPSLAGIAQGSADLIVFRGALFFPGLFTVNFGAIFGALKPGGVACIGGGFGRFTPEEVIAPIAARSRELNLKLGKTEVNPSAIEALIARGAIPGQCRLVRQGGLWIVMRKRGPENV